MKWLKKKYLIFFLKNKQFKQFKYNKNNKWWKWKNRIFWFKIKYSFYLIEEFQNKGELFEYISSFKKGFGEKISKLFFLQILSGLNYYISQRLIFEKNKFDNYN